MKNYAAINYNRLVLRRKKTRKERWQKVNSEKEKKQNKRERIITPKESKLK